MKPCIVCGEPSPESRCPEHPKASGTPPTTSSTSRGYDTTWRKLSERARRIQPWCSDCGTTDDLTTDHSPEAWARKDAGKAIRLRDVDVCCRGCNARRGRARPRGEAPSETFPTCDGEAESRLLTSPLSVEGSDYAPGDTSHRRSAAPNRPSDTETTLPDRSDDRAEQRNPSDEKQSVSKQLSNFSIHGRMIA